MPVAAPSHPFCNVGCRVEEVGIVPDDGIAGRTKDTVHFQEHKLHLTSVRFSGEQAIKMQQIIRPWVCREGLTPVVIGTDESSVVDDAERVGPVRGNNIHHPDRVLDEARREPSVGGGHVHGIPDLVAAQRRKQGLVVLRGRLPLAIIVLHGAGAAAGDHRDALRRHTQPLWPFGQQLSLLPVGLGRRVDAGAHGHVPGGVGVDAVVALGRRSHRRELVVAGGIKRLLPDGDVALLVVELEAHGREQLLEPVKVGLLGLHGGVPSVPPVLVVHRRAGQHPEPPGPEHPVDLHEVKPAELGPGDEAPGAVRHVHGARRERQPLRGDDAEDGRDAALERELDLCLVVVPGRQGQRQDAPGQQVAAPARHAAARVERRAHGAVLHARDEVRHEVHVGADAVGEHGAAAREGEAVAVLAEPVLVGFLAVDPVVGHVAVPALVFALGPADRGPVALGRRHQAARPLRRRRAVALHEAQPVVAVFSPALRVRAGRVVLELGGALAELFLHFLLTAANGRDGDGTAAAAGGLFGGGGDDGGGGGVEEGEGAARAAVDAAEVEGEAAEEEDHERRRQSPRPNAAGAAAHRPLGLCFLAVLHVLSILFWTWIGTKSQTTEHTAGQSRGLRP